MKGIAWGRNFSDVCLWKEIGIGSSEDAALQKESGQ